MSTLSVREDSIQNGGTNRARDGEIRAMALNIADWTASSARALGVESTQSKSLWWRQPGGSPIYLGAVILDGLPSAQLAADLEQARAAWGAEGFAVYDCWASHELANAGFRHTWQTPWYLRRPASIEEIQPPDGLAIGTVTSVKQLAEFEQASVQGFEMPETQWPERFGQHAVATLEDPGMTYFNGRLDGRVVASAIVHITDDMVGIYAISTLPRFRRRGYATALIRAAVALRPDLPASVWPDPPSVPAYTAVGFVLAGEIASWDSVIG